MSDQVVTYLIAAIIAAGPTALSAWLVFKARKNPSGDAQLVDRAAYYAALTDRNEKLQTRNDLLEAGKLLQQEQLEKASETISQLTSQNNRLITEHEECTKDIHGLREDLGAKLKEVKALQGDVIEMNRRIRDLEGHRQ